jgi:type VI secretion system protein
MLKLSISLILIAVFILSGCVSAGKLSQIYDGAMGFILPQKQLKEVTLTSTPDLNDTSPVAVDIVSVSSDEITRMLESLTASQWFNQRDQIKQQFNDNIAISSWEIVPSQRIDAQQLPLISKPYVNTFIFVNYNNQSTNRGFIKDAEYITIVLKRNNFVIVH